MHSKCTCVTNTWTTCRYIGTYIYTRIDKYSDLLVYIVMISVRLALARPNYVYIIYTYQFLFWQISSRSVAPHLKHQ